MNTLSLLSLILGLFITIAILYGDTVFVGSETKEKLWFRAYTIYMKIAIVLMVILAIEDIITPISTNAVLTFNIVFAVIHIMVILYKDIALADAETKEKLWFKIYVTFMKFMVGVMIIMSVEGIMTTIKFW